MLCKLLFRRIPRAWHAVPLACLCEGLAGRGTGACGVRGVLEFLHIFSRLGRGWNMRHPTPGGTPPTSLQLAFPPVPMAGHWPAHIWLPWVMTSVLLGIWILFTHKPPRGCWRECWLVHAVLGGGSHQGVPSPVLPGPCASRGLSLVLQFTSLTSSLCCFVSATCCSGGLLAQLQAFLFLFLLLTTTEDCPKVHPSLVMIDQFGLTPAFQVQQAFK